MWAEKLLSLSQKPEQELMNMTDPVTIYIS